MAEKIAEFPVAQRRATRKYPWEEWADGAAWKLRRGEDFDSKPDQFRNRLYATAAKRQMGVYTSKDVDDDGVEVLYIQFYPLANGASPADDEEY